MSPTPRWRTSPATLQKLQEVTVKLADGTITAEQRTQYQSQAKQLTNNVQSFIKDASYNGLNILDDPSATWR